MESILETAGIDDSRWDQGSDRVTQRRAGVAGLSFAILYMFANSALASIPLAPTGKDTGEEIARYFAQNSSVVLMLDLVLVVSLCCLIWWAYEFRRTLKSLSATHRRSQEAIVAFSIAAATSALCAAALAPMAGLDSLSPVEARTVWDLGTVMGALFAVPLAAITAAIAQGTRGTSLPGWIRGTCFALVPVLLFIFVAWLSIKLWCIWMVALSISLLRGRRWNSPSPNQP